MQDLLQIIRIHTVWIVRTSVKSLARGGERVNTEQVTSACWVRSSLSTAKSYWLLAETWLLPSLSELSETWYLKCMRINPSTIPRTGTNLWKYHKRLRSGIELRRDLVSLLHQGVKISLWQSHFSEGMPKVQNVFWEGQFLPWSVGRKVHLAVNQREPDYVGCGEAHCLSQRESWFLI